MSAIALIDLPGRPCPIAAALELVGERWALLVVRELALGNTRFEDIVRGTGASRDRVAARLKALDQAGVIQRIPYQTAPPRFDYHLTESGRALRPVLDALLAWGWTTRFIPPTGTAIAIAAMTLSIEQGRRHDCHRQWHGQRALGAAALTYCHMARSRPEHCARPGDARHRLSKGNDRR